MRDPTAHADTDDAALRAGLLHETARRFDLCHHDDSFADLTRRAAFSKEDRRRRQDWIDAVASEGGGSHGA